MPLYDTFMELTIICSTGTQFGPYFKQEGKVAKVRESYEEVCLQINTSLANLR